MARPNNPRWKPWLGCGVDDRCGTRRGYKAALRAGAARCSACNGANSVASRANYLKPEVRAATVASHANHRARLLEIKRGLADGSLGRITRDQLEARRLMFPGHEWADFGKGVGKWEWDHVVPLAVGGLNLAANFRPEFKNLSKGAKSHKLFALEEKLAEVTAERDLLFLFFGATLLLERVDSFA